MRAASRLKCLTIAKVGSGTVWYALTEAGFDQSLAMKTQDHGIEVSKFYVDAVFQSSYEDTINKINTSLAGGELPNACKQQNKRFVSITIILK